LTYRNVHHCPNCRRVAGGAVAARYQIAVDPWPVQNGRGGSGSRLSFAGRLRGNGSRNRIRCAGSKQARIVLILKSGDKGKYWKGGALCGDQVATKLLTIAETMERCVAGVCVAGKERKKLRAKCDSRR
jgi:hypothetical protein